MKKIAFILFFFFSINCAVPAQVQHILKSANLEKNDTVWVFTPSDYHTNNSTNYPIIFMMHGWSGNYHQWNDIMDCQSYADKYSYIVVCPDGLYDTWYMNSPALENSQYFDFFFEELVPKIFKEYKIDRNNVFITGLSMGGHGALYLFAQKPELFKSAGSISGVLDLSESSDEYGIKTHMGLTHNEKDKAILMKYSVIGNIDKIAKTEKEIVFSCGTDDQFYEINNEFRKKCDEVDIKAVYISAPGGHNYEYWKDAIKYQFLFFDQLK